MSYMRLRTGVALGLLGLFGRAWGAIGPVADLTIVNKVKYCATCDLTFINNQLTSVY